MLLYINVADTDVPLERDPAHVLMELNSWSDGKMIDGHQRVEGNCRVTTSDNWVFYFSDCKRGYDKYVPPHNLAEDRGKKCCMELANWTNAQVLDRYDDYLKCSHVVSTTQPDFGTVPKAISAHHQRLLDFVKSVHSVFGKIQESFDYLDRFIIDYANRTVAQVQLTEDYLANMGRVLDLASSEAGGLTSKLNCSFVRTLVDNVSSNVCGNAIPGLYLLTLLLGASVGSGLFLTAAILVLMRRMKKRLRRR